VTDAERLAEFLPSGVADLRFQSEGSDAAHGTVGVGVERLTETETEGFALRRWHSHRLDTWFTPNLDNQRAGRKTSGKTPAAPALPDGCARSRGPESPAEDWATAIEHLHEAGIRAGRRPDYVRHWVLRVHRSASTLVNTAGARIEISAESFSAEVRAVGRGRSAVKFGRTDDAVSAVAMMRRLDEAAVRAVTAVTARVPAEHPSGPIAIVADPDFAGLLAHELVGHPLEADVARTLPPNHWVHAAGPVGGLALTVVDDPFTLGLGAFDHEGVPARAVRLLDRGAVAGQLHSLETVPNGAVPTGHARAATWRDPVLPRMTATGFTEGSGPLEALMERCGDGIFLHGARGGWCGADGEFTAVSQGSRLITRGRLGVERGPVLLRGEARRLLAAVAAVSQSGGLRAGGEGGCGKAGQSPVATASLGGGVLLHAVADAVPLWR
jgi:predicted Zn-dependent protease